MILFRQWTEAIIWYFLFDDTLNIVPLWISESFGSWTNDYILVASSTPHYFPTAIHNLELWVIFMKPTDRSSFVTLTHSSLASPIIWSLITLVESSCTSTRPTEKLGGTKRKINISIRSSFILLRKAFSTDGHWEIPINMGSVPFSLKSSSIERGNQIFFRASS